MRAPKEISLLASECGYNEYTKYIWYSNSSDKLKFKVSNLDYGAIRFPGFVCTAPTLYQLLDWLREEKCVDIEIVHSRNPINSYTANVTIWKSADVDEYENERVVVENAISYYLALEIAINVALQILKKRMTENTK